ncbi:MAG: hypothetical protein ABGY75_02280 [Gemmataceae bacterium]
MIDTRREVAEGRFRTLVLSWLNSLPPGGWEGMSHQLGEELGAFGDRHRLSAYVPACPARKVAGFLADSGFALTFRRTKSERLIRLTPAGAVRKRRRAATRDS